MNASGIAAENASVAIDGGQGAAINSSDTGVVGVIAGNVLVNGFILESTGAKCLQASVRGDVEMTSPIAAGCGSDGLQVELVGGGVFVGKNTTTLSNGLDGLEVIFNSESSTDKYDVTMSHISALSNGDDGIWLSRSQSSLVKDSQSNQNADDGLDIDNDELTDIDIPYNIVVSGFVGNRDESDCGSLAGSYFAASRRPRGALQNIS